MTRKRTKILECIRQGQIGGGESHLLVLVTNLDVSKFESVVLSFTDGPMIQKLNDLGIKNHVIQTEKPFDIRIWKRVKDLLINENIELIHVHGSRANSNMLWAARSLKIPIIYTIHGWSFHQDQNFITRKLRIFGEKYLTSKSSLNISVSESNKQSGKKFIKNFQSVVVNNGIDQNKFNPDNTFADIRKELKIDRDAILLVFIARVTSHKQPLALIEAFSKTVNNDNKLHLLLVGDGDQKEEGIALIRKYGIDTNVTILPFRQDVPDLLFAADIYVLPSLWEGLPIALLEAMAMGKAVIGSNVDGTSEVIINGENGLLVDSNNLVYDLVEKINMLATDKALRQKLSKNALETVKNKYNAITMTREIELLYNRFV